MSHDESTEDVNQMFAMAAEIAKIRAYAAEETDGYKVFLALSKADSLEVLLHSAKRQSEEKKNENKNHG